jgi:hypothetical protein
MLGVRPSTQQHVAMKWLIELRAFILPPFEPDGSRN